MAGSIVLRSYLDLINGPLENTVNYSNDRNPLEQQYSSLRKFTKRVGKLAVSNSTDENYIAPPLSKKTGEKGFTFNLTAAHSETVENPDSILSAIQNKMVQLANGQSVSETPANSLVYHKDESWAEYVLDFGNDIKNPRYLAFFNLDSSPIYICKSCKVVVDGNNDATYTLVPFLKVLPNQSIGPIIFNPRYGLLFVASDNTSEEQDLYVIAYNA